MFECMTFLLFLKMYVGMHDIFFYFECMRILIIIIIYLFFKKNVNHFFFFVHFSKPNVSMQSLNLLTMNFDFDFFILPKISTNLNA